MVLWSVQAAASLGGDALSLQADRAALHGVVTHSAHADYDSVEISTDSGMAVREFADRSGAIFAVSWSGPAAPDLRQLLGVHFDAYAHVLSQLSHPGLHRSLRVQTAGLVVECSGHLRAYVGRAFLPRRLPAGFAIEHWR